MAKQGVRGRRNYFAKQYRGKKALGTGYGKGNSFKTNLYD